MLEQRSRSRRVRWSPEERHNVDVLQPLALFDEASVNPLESIAEEGEGVDDLQN